MFIISNILYILDKKVKKSVLNILKIKTIYFSIYPQFSSTALSNQLIASDLLILRIIQQLSTFVTVIIVISLILRHNIVKS